MTTPPFDSPSVPPPPAAPAGWYPDPANTGSWRYWDGLFWAQSSPVNPNAGNPTSGVAATPPPTTPVAAPSPGVAPAAWSPVPGLTKWWTGTPRKSKIAIGGVAAAALVLGGVAFAGQRVEESRSCPVPAVAGDLKKLQDGVGPDTDLDRVMIKANAPGRVGQEVRDGDFAFLVHSIDACPGKQVKVAMTVTNTKDAPRMFRADNQKLLRTPSRPTGPEPAGGYSCATCDGIGVDFNLNPGDAFDTVVNFDIGGDDPQITAIVVHDSWLSNGVMVFP